jgi:hypothetical protein
MCSSSTSIKQLKAKVEVEAGIKAAALFIYHPEVNRPLAESITLAECGLPSKLYMFTLHKAIIADMIGVHPHKLSDKKLDEACSTTDGKAGDIVSLAGCTSLCDMRCLVWLEQMQELDISECKSVDATTVAQVIADNGTLSKLTFGGDEYGPEWDRQKPAPATLEVGMTE